MAEVNEKFNIEDEELEQVDGGRSLSDLGKGISGKKGRHGAGDSGVSKSDDFLDFLSKRRGHR